MKASKSLDASTALNVRKKKADPRSEVLTAVKISTLVFWVVSRVDL
jgi:hypothetical protein